MKNRNIFNFNNQPQIQYFDYIRRNKKIVWKKKGNPKIQVIRHSQNRETEINNRTKKV